MIKKLLKAVTGIMAFIFIFSMCNLDSPSWIPTICCAVALAWIYIYGAATGWGEEM